MGSTTASAPRQAPEGQAKRVLLLLGLLGVLILVFALTALLTGDLVFIIPVLIAGALWVGFFLLVRGLGRRSVRHHSSQEDAMGDETESIPSAPFVPDDETPLGDTTEAHDEISPHDLPLGHPGRQAAEHQAAAGDGTTQGDSVGDRRHDRRERDREAA